MMRVRFFSGVPEVSGAALNIGGSLPSRRFFVRRVAPRSTLLAKFYPIDPAEVSPEKTGFLRPMTHVHGRFAPGRKSLRSAVNAFSGRFITILSDQVLS